MVLPNDLRIEVICEDGFSILEIAREIDAPRKEIDGRLVKYALGLQSPSGNTREAPFLNEILGLSSRTCRKSSGGVPGGIERILNDCCIIL